MEYFNIEEDIEDFLNGKITVNCKTKDDVIEFLDFLKSKYLIKWSNSCKLSAITYLEEYGNEIAYKIKKGKLYYSCISNGWYEENNYKVLVYKSTELKSDIKLKSEQKTNLNIKSSNKRKIFIIEDE